MARNKSPRKRKPSKSGDSHAATRISLREYLGRYLKRPPVAASQLRHYSG